MAHKIPDPPSLGEVEQGEVNKDLVSGKDRALRQDSAVAARVAGATYSEIARLLDYPDAKSARLAVERALAATVGEESREQLRFLEARRLDRILRALWNKVTNEEHPEQLTAARTALAVIDRHARLYGLDAPTEHVVYSPTSVEIEKWVSQMLGQTVQALPEEADVVDGEVLDGD